MFSHWRQIRPAPLAFFLLLALTCYRLWYATRIELVPDEAYYWLWSKNLAASYRDKGPLVAWTIALGTRLFGDTVFAIRFFAVLLSAGIGWVLFVLARRLYDDRVALWCLLLANVIPELAVGSILMTIDPLSVFFWALATLFYWKVVNGGGTLDWFWTGLAVGVGFLAKFTNGIQLACIGLFLLWSKEHRRLLFSRGPVMAGLAFVLAVTPILWWNIQTGWIHAVALRSRSGVKDSFGVHPGEFLEYIGGQLAVISPLIMIGMAVAAVALTCRRNADVRTRFLLSQFLPVYGVFTFFALNKTGQANWTAPALVTGVIFTVTFWRERLARNPAWRGWIGAAFAIAIVMSAVMHNTRFLNLPPKSDPLRRAQGWADFAQHVQHARVDHQADLLIADHYSQASMMAFYLPDRPTTYVFTQPYGKSQFTLWPGYKTRTGTRALYVTDSLRAPPKVLQQEFTRVELVDDFWSQHRGRPMTRFRIYLCTRT